MATIEIVRQAVAVVAFAAAVVVIVLDAPCLVALSDFDETREGSFSRSRVEQIPLPIVVNPIVPAAVRVD